jgi:hypothetical protein
MMLSAVCLALLSEPQSPAVAKLNVVAGGGGGGGGDKGRSCFAYVNDVIVIAIIKPIIVNKDTIISMILSSRGVTIFVMGF